MAAALVAAVTATQVITGCKNHQPVIQVVVLAFNQRNYRARAAAFPHRLKDKRCASAVRSSGSGETALEILAVKEIVDVAKEAQRPRVAM